MQSVSCLSLCSLYDCPRGHAGKIITPFDLVAQPVTPTTVTNAPKQRSGTAGELHGIVALTEERRDDLALRGGHEPHVRHERRRTLHEHRTHRKEEHRVVRGRRHVRRRRRCARAAVRRVARSSRKLAGRADEPLLGEPPLAAFADWLSKDTTQSSDNHAKSKRLAVK